MDVLNLNEGENFEEILIRRNLDSLQSFDEIDEISLRLKQGREVA